MTGRRLRSLAAAALTVGVAAASGVTVAASAASAPVVEAGVHTVLVDWGSRVDPAQAAAGAGVLDALDNSGYLRGLAAAYSLSSRAVYLGAGAVPDSSLPSTTTNSTVDAALRAQIHADALPAPVGATNYVVMLPPSASGSFCSSHHSFTIGSTRAYVIVIADYNATVPQCGGGASDAPGAVGVNVSRQLVNAITDPVGQGSGVMQSGTGAEIGSACAQTGASGNVDGFLVQPWWDNAAGACSFGTIGVGIGAEVPKVTNARTATFRLHDTEATAGQTEFACAIDGTTVGCDTSAPLATSGLPGGSHLLDVTAQGVGEAKYSWLVDLTAPSAPVVAGLPAVRVGPTVTVAYSARDTGGSGVAAYDVRYRSAAWNSGYQRWLQPAALQARSAAKVTVAVQPGRTYCFSVRAHDVAGNISPWSDARCTSVPLDDRSIVATAGWRKLAAAAAFRHTLSVSSAAGAQLQLAKAHLRRLALVVRTCPTCGRVKVFRGGVLWRSVSTRSARAHNRVVIMLPDIGMRTVTIRLTAAGRAPVSVDGVAVLPI